MNTDTSKRRSLSASLLARLQGWLGAALLIGAAWLTAGTANAASGTWTSTSSSTWGTPGGTPATNWNSTTVPGAASGVTDADTATFNSAGVTITLPTYLNIENFTFNGAAGSFTFNEAVGGNPVYLTAAGAITFTSTTATGTVTETFSTPLTLEGNYTFTNSATSASDTLDFTGAITNAASTAATLTLSGTNTGANTISGGISNNANTAAATTAISQGGTGTWIIGGTNTYTGGTTLGGGGTNASYGTSLLDLTGSFATPSILSKQGIVELDLNAGFTSTAAAGPNLTLETGEIRVNGISSGASSLTIDGLSSAGSSSSSPGNINSLVLSDNGGSGITLNLSGNVTEATPLSLLNVTASANDVLQSVANGAITGQNNTLPFAILNQNDILGFTNSTGSQEVLGAATYTVPTGPNPTITPNSGPATILIDNTSTGNVSLTGTTSINSLVFGDTSSRTLALQGNDLLIGSGGSATILSRTTAGALTVGSTAGDGQITIPVNGLLLVNNSSTTDVMNAVLTSGGTPASGNDGQYGVALAGTGSWAFAGNNTYTGGTYLMGGGTLDVNSSGALGVTSTSFPDALVITNGSLDNTSGAPVTLSSANMNDVPIAANASFTFIGTNSLDLGAGTFSTSVSGLSITVDANTLAFDGTFTASKGFGKYGAGTLALNGNYTSASGGTVHAGALAFNGTNSGGAGFTVATGATLSGTGNFGAGALSLQSGGNITPGAAGTSTGTLSAASMTFSAGASLTYVLSNTSNATGLLSLSGAFSKSGTGVFDIDLTGGVVGDTYDLVNFGSTTFTGTAASNFTAVGDTGTFTFAGAGSDDLDFTLTSAAVPEPSVLSLMAMGVFLLSCSPQGRSLWKRRFLHLALGGAREES
jgi:fibronectin-binding autotransporter adhesin